MLKRGGVFLLILIVFGILFSQGVYAKDHYVSNLGSDSNDGSLNSPWKTISKVNSVTFQSGDKILFNRGDFWEGTLTVTSSGTSSNPIVYGAYGEGEKPKIFGSEEITGWTLHSGNIYKATVNQDINQLFLDGERMKLARTPNAGYFTIHSVPTTTQLTSNDLDGSMNYAGTKIVGRDSRFTFYSRDVLSSNSKTLTISSSPTYKLDVGEGFFLADKYEFLDSPGEWYYNPSTKTVYFWTPSGTSPNNYEIRGSVKDYGFHLVNKNYITIKDIEILHSSHTGIYSTGSTYMNVDNVNIISPEIHGIYATSSGHTYTNNYIYQTGGGIRNTGATATIITNNTIERIGQFEDINKAAFLTYDNYGTGIYLRNGNPTVQYNRVLDVGYAGINWRGVGSIKYNYINGVCQVLDDCGGIYTYTPSVPTGSAGSEVMYNIVLNAHGNREGYTGKYDAGNGIYMDNGATDIKIQYNTVAGATAGVFLHDNNNVLVQYNTIYDALVGTLAAGELGDSYFYDNLLFATDRLGDYNWNWINHPQKMMTRDSASPVYDRNRYYQPYETSVFKASIGTMDFSSWKSATGQDSNSNFYGSPLATGETEKLLFNAKNQIASIDLFGRTFKDLDGNTFTGSLTLQPFTSKILIGTNFDGINSVTPDIILSPTIPSNPPLEEPTEQQTSPTEETIQNPEFPAPRAKYSFEETSGTIIQDKISSNDGTIFNEENRVEGVRGNGLNLTGLGYINLGKDFGNIREQLTLSIWIKPVPAITGYQGIIMQGGPVDDTFAIYLHATNNIIALKTTSTTNPWTQIFAPSIWDGSWHHIVATYDGSKKTIYLDGNILTSAEATGLIESGEGYNLLLGAGRDIEEPTLLYNGLIDEFSIYNSSLNLTQVEQLYIFGDEIVVESEVTEQTETSSATSTSSGKSLSSSNSSNSPSTNIGGDVESLNENVSQENSNETQIEGEKKLSVVVNYIIWVIVGVIIIFILIVVFTLYKKIKFYGN